MSEEIPGGERVDEHITAFDNFEDMQAYLAKGIATAKSNIQEFQRPLLDGKQHWFIRLYRLYGTTLVITGWCVDLDQHASAMYAKYGGDAEGKEEIDWELKSMRERLEDGFLFTHAYSEAEPRGELGDTHVATMLEVPESVFLRLKEVGFGLEAALADPELRDWLMRWATEVNYT